MSVHRFLSKRDKHRDSSKLHRVLHSTNNSSKPDNSTLNSIDTSSAADFYGLFCEKGKPSSSEESKIKTVRQRIVTKKAVLLRDSHILWAIRSNFSNGDLDHAYDLLIAMSDASEGIVIPYNPSVRLVGAVNRQAVTCFLDSTLFAMFSRLDSFEAMLYNSFDDLPRNRLGFLLRLWVNLLRSGKLITTDITMHIQEELAACGWEEAVELHQQDASEAFAFITEKLRLPLLTLKMDMFHAGKQDADDHRFINERLLEVAIPAGENGEHKDIKLEDCLEDYFNNRIEVRRYLGRKPTMGSMRSFDSELKSDAVHVETVEVDDDSSPMTPLSPLPTYMSSVRPSVRHRASSIIQERFVPEKEEDTLTDLPSNDGSIKGPLGRLRKGSVRKEVLMPAWQFFSLIPWYTDNAPSTDAQVADHFSSKRPILGLCLKRYSMQPNGKAIRLDTYVDIPLEIGLPHFIQDDHMQDDGPFFGNFKLSLQSMVCHRGNSVDSGHYISLVRGTNRPGNEIDTNAWMRFDDLARERITMIDIHKALREETPYLLFYQIVPIDGDPGNLTVGENPPLYDGPVNSLDFGGVSAGSESQLSYAGSQPPSERPSMEIPVAEEDRGRIPTEARRPSLVVFTEQQRPSSKRIGSDNEETERRKSQSLTRSYARGASALTKTLSNLGSGKPKDSVPTSQTMENGITVEVSEAVSHDEPPRNGSVVHAAEVSSKHQKREKSRNRLGKGLGKHHHQDPDRECIVM